MLQSDDGGTSSISGSSTNTFGFTGTVVEVTVQTTGEYDIDAFGAAGGATEEAGAGGLGAEEGGSIVLVAGEQLEIVVGGAGAASNGPIERDAGGGGGTFVFADTGLGGGFVPLLVAGGGSGALEFDGSKRDARRPGVWRGRCRR